MYQEPLKLNSKQIETSIPLKKSLKDISKHRDVQTAGKHRVTCTQQVHHETRRPCTSVRTAQGQDTDTERWPDAEQQQLSARLAGHSGAATVEGSLAVSYKTKCTRIYTKELES